MTAARPTQEELRAQGLCGAPQFKDAWCDYQGPEDWCDRTRARCDKLGNVERFDCAKPRRRNIPWWDISLGSGVLLTMLLAPPWWVAGPLYAFFFSFLLPPVRREVFYWFQLRRLEREALAELEDDGPSTSDSGDK